jgi:hypothetical protein
VSNESYQNKQGIAMTIEQMLNNLHAMAQHTAPPKPLPKLKK